MPDRDPALEAALYSLIQDVAGLLVTAEELELIGTNLWEAAQDAAWAVAGEHVARVAALEADVQRNREQVEQSAGMLMALRTENAEWRQQVAEWRAKAATLEAERDVWRDAIVSAASAGEDAQ